jgi:hypothetical protein
MVVAVVAVTTLKEFLVLAALAVAGLAVLKTAQMVFQELLILAVEAGVVEI